MHNACDLQKLRPSSRWGAFLLTHLIFMGQIRNRPCRHRIHLGKTHEKTALGLNFWCSHAAKVVLSCVVSVGISYTGVWAQSLISATSAMSADMNLDNWFLENALILSTFRGLYEVYNRGLSWVQDTSWYIIIYIYTYLYGNQLFWNSLQCSFACCFKPMFSCTCHRESPEMVLDLGEQGPQIHLPTESPSEVSWCWWMPTSSSSFSWRQCQN